MRLHEGTSTDRNSERLERVSALYEALRHHHSATNPQLHPVPPNVTEVPCKFAPTVHRRSARSPLQ
jgi:hypothetical protein